MAAAAVTDGMLTLDEAVSDTLTEWQSDPEKCAITVRQLLSMTSGVPSEIGKPPSYAAALDVPLIAEPGEKFLYGPVPMQIFGEFMRRKLEDAGYSPDPLAYLDARILKPIGITDYKWRKGKDGNPLMPQGAILSADQWAKYGEFVLHRGNVNGEQMVDKAAFDELFAGSQANPAYGLTWWLGRATSTNDPVTANSDLTSRLEELPPDIVFAAGAGDQRLYVIPSLNMVIVRQAKLDIASLIANKGKSEWSDTDFLTMLLECTTTPCEPDPQ